LAACVVATLVPAAGATAEHSVLDVVELPAPAAVGQRAIADATVATTIDGGTATLRLVTSSSIIDVGDDGSYTARSLIESVEVTNAPASADVTSWGLDDLEGTSFDRLYDPSGAPVTLTRRSPAPRSFVLDSMSMVSLGFPTSPIEVGDSWTVTGRIASEGMTFGVTYRCRLKSVSDVAYDVDVSYAEGFTITLPSGTAEGTISGTGTLRGSLLNPLVLSGGLHQTIDGVVTTGNAATAMRHDTSITINSSGG
jgi:hypothetical protein